MSLLIRGSQTESLAGGTMTLYADGTPLSAARTKMPKDTDGPAARRPTWASTCSS